MKTNSKNKGSRFERTITKWFEEWTGYKFSRTPGSGGWAKSKDAFGDLVCTDEKHGRRFPFSIECKNYKDIKFEHLLLGNKACKIKSFWDQAVHDAIRCNKIPMLIMKYNGMAKNEGFMVVSSVVADLLAKQLSKEPDQARFMCIMNRSTVGDLYVFLLSDIKRLVDYPILYKEAKKLIKK